jgi:hypothetical protein
MFWSFNNFYNFIIVLQTAYSNLKTGFNQSCFTLNKVIWRGDKLSNFGIKKVHLNCGCNVHGYIITA